MSVSSFFYECLILSFINRIFCWQEFLVWFTVLSSVATENILLEHSEIKPILKIKVEKSVYSHIFVIRYLGSATFSVKVLLIFSLNVKSIRKQKLWNLSQRKFSDIFYSLLDSFCFAQQLTDFIFWLLSDYWEWISEKISSMFIAKIPTI